MGRHIFLICSLIVLMPRVLLGAEGAAEVPFRLYRGYSIVVRGEIGTLKKLNFLVDTGAIPSVIDQRVARKLRLGSHTEELSVSGRIVEAESVVLPEIHVGPVRAESVRALVCDLAFIEAGLGVRIDGMVGLDVLGKANFSIDFESRKLCFGGPRIRGPRVAFEAGLPYVVVAVQEQGRAIRLLVDTGTNHLILFERKEGPRLQKLRTLGTRSLSNISGPITLQQVELADPQLGNLPLPERLALVVDTPAGAARNFDGLLGVKALGAKRVAFDFDRRELSWAH